MCRVAWKESIGIWLHSFVWIGLDWIGCMDWRKMHDWDGIGLGQAAWTWMGGIYSRMDRVIDGEGICLQQDGCMDGRYVGTGGMDRGSGRGIH